MVEAGMISWIDAVGNVRGRAPSARPAAPALLVGSHYDTVIDGGKYDGALGILTGIAAVKVALLEAAVGAGALPPGPAAAAAAAAAAAGARLDLRRLLLAHEGGVAAAALARPVEVAAFADEEGVRFQSTFLGSRALAGTLVSAGLLQARDAGGATLSRALEDAGMDGSEAGVAAAALRPEQVDAYVEVHMEQGPVLEAAGRRLGGVSAIAGQARLAVEVVGHQGHAGTVPMALRRDPLTAAAEAVGALERLCAAAARGDAAAAEAEAAGGATGAALTGGGGPRQGSGLVCTVGALGVWPNAGNVIPGRVNFTVDVRSGSDAQRVAVVAAWRARLAAGCARRGVRCGVEVRHEAAAVAAAPEVAAALVAAVEESAATFDRVMSHHFKLAEAAGQAAGEGAGAGGRGSCSAGDLAGTCTGVEPHPPLPIPLMVSGAGHDAMAMANLTRVGMLFVRCRAGVSHSPAEFVAPDDVAAGVAALHRFLSAWEAAGGAVAAAS
jgi:allantoate deiminase